MCYFTGSGYGRKVGKSWCEVVTLRFMVNDSLLSIVSVINIILGEMSETDRWISLQMSLCLLYIDCEVGLSYYNTENQRKLNCSVIGHLGETLPSDRVYLCTWQFTLFCKMNFRCIRALFLVAFLTTITLQAVETSSFPRVIRFSVWIPKNSKLSWTFSNYVIDSSKPWIWVLHHSSVEKRLSFLVLGPHFFNSWVLVGKVSLMWD